MVPFFNNAVDVRKPRNFRIRDAMSRVTSVGKRVQVQEASLYTVLIWSSAFSLLFVVAVATKIGSK